MTVKTFSLSLTFNPTMERRTNRRGVTEHFVGGRHLKLDDLKEAAQGLETRQYLFRENIPAYPRPEFHVSHLKHDTDLEGLLGIKRDGGFRSLGPESLLWWSLAVKPEDVTSAETRLLEETYPDRTEEQVQTQQSFLGKFTTSPAFLETSRLGSYRFTFPVEEVLEAYREQFCGGEPPVLQVFETVLYKQEVMYVVLVDRPANQQYSSLSDDPNAVCVYRDGRFIWRPEAMCETHSFELVQKPDVNQMELFPCSRHFYVWDHVAIALHVGKGKVLKFHTDQLRGNLKFCDPGEPQLSYFESFADAEEIVGNLWPEYPAQLEKQISLQEMLYPWWELLGFCR
ncbi:uncharacterized protein LOC108892342 [Lates calcarifer]|uniref:Uncharacterized protein LOC108892342 n=1 Tax=Lates calcarifer TaxID=8187 RepID=A0AAJ7Q337_LATCA|nr:uncharacterized protein LOC108892342 [Lates calcarifer]